MSSVRPRLSPETPKVVTSWDVRTGAVIYRTPAGDWDNDISRAEILSGDAADAALATASADEGHSVDPYLMEVSDTGAVTGRETLRETIRAEGPTVHPHFRKSASGGAA